jgi:hypothetical protein
MSVSGCLMLETDRRIVAENVSFQQVRMARCDRPRITHAKNINFFIPVKPG